MKIYIAYCYSNEFDDVIYTFDNAYKTRLEAIDALGRHIITEEKFKDFYEQQINIRDGVYKEWLGEEYNLPNFSERCNPLRSRKSS